VIDFTYLEGGDGDIVVKVLAAVDFQSKRVSSYDFKRPYGWEDIPMFDARMNETIDHGCNWNDSHVLYSELETVVHRESSSVVAIYCFGPQNTQCISSHIDRAAIDITQLGCTPLTDIILPTLSCTFACLDKSEQVCVLRTDYLFSHWLNLQIISLQYAKCPPQPVFH
jgi:hypothetical protein